MVKCNACYCRGVACSPPPRMPGKQGGTAGQLPTAASSLWSCCWASVCRASLLGPEVTGGMGLAAPGWETQWVLPRTAQPPVVPLKTLNLFFPISGRHQKSPCEHTASGSSLRGSGPATAKVRAACVAEEGLWCQA